MIFEDHKRIIITMEKDFVAKLDFAADVLGVSRCAVIRKALARDFAYAMAAEIAEAQKNQQQLAAYKK